MKFILPALIAATLANTPAYAVETAVSIPVGALKTAPVVDGVADDWKDINGVEIPLTYLGKPELTKTVTLKAGV